MKCGRIARIEEAINEYLSESQALDDSQPLFQSVNKAGTALSGAR